MNIDRLAANSKVIGGHSADVGGMFRDLIQDKSPNIFSALVNFSHLIATPNLIVNVIALHCQFTGVILSIIWTILSIFPGLTRSPCRGRWPVADRSGSRSPWRRGWSPRP